MRFSFRAWHSGERTMIDNCNQGYEGNVFSWAAEGQPVEIMQGTGLHDKNGKEMYEGDIVYVAGVGLVTVEFSSLGFWQFGEFNDYVDVCEDIEDIRGNIYENPELLKQAA